MHDIKIPYFCDLPYLFCCFFLTALQSWNKPILISHYVYVGAMGIRKKI